jgi:hypothetical protein
MIVQVWTLKRGILTPPEPLEDSEKTEALWWAQDHPVNSTRMSRWRESEVFRSVIASEGRSQRRGSSWQSSRSFGNVKPNT